MMTPAPEVFIDTETTGLDPMVHEILEFTGKKRLPGTNKPPVVLTFKVKPDRIEAADPKAIEVNGYTEEAWADAISQQDAAQQIMDFIEGCVVLGQNTAYGMGMIKATCSTVNSPQILPASQPSARKTANDLAR